MRIITDNFFIPNKALRKVDNAIVWNILASGLHIKYRKYWEPIISGTIDEDTLYINDYELPTMWSLLTQKDPLVSIIDGELLLTQKGKDLLNEIIKAYSKKYVILSVAFSENPFKARAINCDNKDADYSYNKDYALYVNVQEIVKNKKTNIMHRIDMRMRRYEQPGRGQDGFMDYFALSKEALKQINDLLTEKQKTDITELLLANKGNDKWHIRDYILD